MLEIINTYYCRFNIIHIVCSMSIGRKMTFWKGPFGGRAKLLRGCSAGCFAMSHGLWQQHFSGVSQDSC